MRKLPPAPALRIEKQGDEATHVFCCGLTSARDREIWDYASFNDYIVVTKDDDFARGKSFQHMGQELSGSDCPIAASGNCSFALSSILEDMLDGLDRAKTFVEVI